MVIKFQISPKTYIRDLSINILIGAWSITCQPVSREWTTFYGILHFDSLLFFSLQANEITTQTASG